MSDWCSGEAHRSPDNCVPTQSSDTDQATLLPTHDQWVLPRSPRPLSPTEIEFKVNSWLDDQFSPISSRRSRHPNGDQSPAPPFPLPAFEKRVHWTPSVIDNDGKTSRSLKNKEVDDTMQTKVTWQFKPHSKVPAVPDPPRAKNLPKAPRPGRLPSPELPELENVQFCTCCSATGGNKVNAQSKHPRNYSPLDILFLTSIVAIATMHIAATRLSARRKT
jgi:hypothetical protein